MDQVGSWTRRQSAASRRVIRESNSSVNNDEKTPPNCKSSNSRERALSNVPNNSWRSAVQDGSSLTMILSRALSNIDRHNAEYFNGNDNDNDNSGDTVISFSSPEAVGEGLCTKTNNSSGEVEYESYYPKKKRPLKPLRQADFSSYLQFQRSSLRCLFGFLAIYTLVIICCYPMISISYDNINNNNNNQQLERGASFQHIRGRDTFIKVKSKLGSLEQQAVQWQDKTRQKTLEKRQHMEQNIMDQSTVGRAGGKDAIKASELLNKAIQEFELLRGQEDKIRSAQDHQWNEAVRLWNQTLQGQKNEDELTSSSRDNIYRNLHGDKTPGVMILGMHRSGTSMLAGLLVKGFGYETGGPLIGAAFDNEKGFYERIDVVLQNDEFFEAQQIGWSFNVYNYNSTRALQDKLHGTTVTFVEGSKALRFLNNPHRAFPYLQKDPRMCITLSTWLKLLDHPPAIVFTYRHPLEVAMSLKKREKGITLEHGLRLWVVYNMRAIQNSVGLCRIFSTNDAIFKNTLVEVQRISKELTERCHVIAPPTLMLSKEVVDTFVDPSLHHNDKEREKGGGEEVRQGCIAPLFQSEFPENSVNHKREKEMLLMAIEVFCDLENGDAFKSDYVWPDLETMTWPAKVH